MIVSKKVCDVCGEPMDDKEISFIDIIVYYGAGRSERFSDVCDDCKNKFVTLINVIKGRE